MEGAGVEAQKLGNREGWSWVMKRTLVEGPGPFLEAGTARAKQWQHKRM